MERNEKLLINVKSYEKDKNREFKLPYFNTTYEILPVEKIKDYIRHYHLLHPFLKKCYRTYLPIRFKRYFDDIKNGQFHPELLKAKKGYFYGYWGHPRYFENIRTVVRNEFHIKKKFITENLTKAKLELSSLNSVAVHIRRGDYVKNPVFNKIFISLPSEYYLRSFEFMSQNLTDPHFIIFSDDLAWTRRTFNSMPYPITFADEFDLKEDYLEFDLMRSCKHFIIANSTFSWWAAWLGDNKDKLVISPKLWYRGNNKSTGFIPETWIIF